MSGVLSILVADDHALLRETLKRSLETEPGLKVVASVSNAEKAVAKAVRLKPDIVLMDIDMPGLLCFDAARTIGARCPETRVIFLSAFFHDRYIEQALAVGASGYVTKSEPPESLVKAIRAVGSGAAYYSPEVQSRIVADTQGPRLATGEGHTLVSTLTGRELEVLRYLARGMLKHKIAETMHLSENTVRRHTTSLMTKLQIHDRVELARFAIREGLAEA
ncbi:MAG: response regulator transcription factor [Phycisphaerae bacterium]|nr:response regulator transcription factor [Phycisphaerae bacterium]